MKAAHSIDHPLAHLFERASVIPQRRLLAKAYQHPIGQRGADLDKVTKVCLADERLIHVKEGSRMMSTTKEVMADEKLMVELAQKGVGQLTPLYKEAPKLRLNDQQAEAVTHLLPHQTVRPL